MRSAFRASLVALLFIKLPALAEDCSENRGAQLAYADRNAWVSWCERCGGEVIISAGPPSCRPGAHWGAGAADSAASAVPFVPTGRPEFDLPLMGLGLGLQMLSEGLKGNANAQQQRQARREAEEYARELEAQQRAAAEAARRKASHERLSGQIKGIDSAGKLALKGREGSDAVRLKTDGERGASFDDYLARETTRRQALERTANPWCKLHAPRYPQRPSMAIPEAQYTQMLAYYQATKVDWDKWCGPSANAEPPPAADAGADAEPALAATGASKRGLVPLPIACDDCWTNYERQSNACIALDTSVERLVCLNSVRDDWVFCVGGCRAEPTPAAKLRPGRPSKR